MKKLLIAVTAASVAALAAPAGAQYSNQQNQYRTNNQAAANIETRIVRLESRLENSIEMGQIDRYEARELRRDVRDLRRLYRQYARNGISQQERADLQERIRDFREELRLAGGAGTDQYGAWDEDDGYYGQGGPYEQVDQDCERRSGGLGGVIGSIFGGNDDDDCRTLRVGQRVSGSLGPVPYQYRNRYRDGGGVYYRSDGQAIYQIDARTHTVIRIYDM